MSGALPVMPPGWGLRANWILHSPTIPKWRMTLIATSRRPWYSKLFKVWEGAMTIDSPVWIPIGSKFSMLQTVMQLSNLSRTTSYSISFHPSRYSSIRICLVLASARREISVSCFLFLATPESCPPSEKPPRTITGKPIFFAAPSASFSLFTAILFGYLAPISSKVLTKRCLSSVFSIAAVGVPKTLTLYFAKVPVLTSSKPQFRAVCPPKERIIPWGFSVFITSSIK